MTTQVKVNIPYLQTERKVKIIRQNKLADGSWVDGPTQIMDAPGDAKDDYIYQTQRLVIEEE